MKRMPSHLLCHAAVLCGLALSSCCCRGHGDTGKVPKGPRIPDCCVKEGYKQVCDGPAQKAGVPWKLWRTGDHGPPVLLLCDILGPRPKCLQVGRDVAGMDGGRQVFVPELFGTFGKESKFLGGWTSAMRHGWNTLRADADQPVLPDLEKLCATLHEWTGRKVVVIGNCLSGGAAVALLKSPHVCGAVASQPALPFLHKESFDMSPRTLEAAKEQANHDTQPALLGFNFHSDKVCTHPRFVMLKDKFNTAMLGVDFCYGQKEREESEVQGLQPEHTCVSTQHSVLIPLEDEEEQVHHRTVLHLLEVFLKQHRST